MADKLKDNKDQQEPAVTVVAAATMSSYYSERLSQVLGPNGVMLKFTNNRHITTNPETAKYLDDVISRVEGCGFHKE